MSGLPIADLEAVYDALAQAIDAAGPEKSELLLTKLALLLAQATGQRDVVLQAITDAALDL